MVKCCYNNVMGVTHPGYILLNEQELADVSHVLPLYEIIIPDIICKVVLTSAAVSNVKAGTTVWVSISDPLQTF